MEKIIENAFVNKILDENFSCIGAKASIKNTTYQFCLLEKMNHMKSTRELYEALTSFTKKRLEIDKRYASFIACFEEDEGITPANFEHVLWQQLKMLHDIDDYEWDTCVSRDIKSSYFSFSISGEAYFVIGMCPGHPRKCRDFPYPALIFNSHHQFKYLKQINLFDKIKKIVRLREKKYSGSVNSNLLDFGDQSEAMQYSGLAVSSHWSCPFNFDKNKIR